MMRMLTFATGLGVGYTLGAKAGRERYDDIRSLADHAKHSAPMEKVMATANERGGALIEQAKSKVPAIIPGIGNSSGDDGTSGGRPQADTPSSGSHNAEGGPLSASAPQSGVLTGFDSNDKADMKAPTDGATSRLDSNGRAGRQGLNPAVNESDEAMRASRFAAANTGRAEASQGVGANAGGAAARD